MVSLLSYSTPIHLSKFPSICNTIHTSTFQHRDTKSILQNTYVHHSINALGTNSFESKQQFRTLFPGEFQTLEDKEKLFIETERMVLLEAISVIRKAAPQMEEEILLLNDATSKLDEPFLVVIVGEFNSGKSTFINALLGRNYLKEGVIPTTNEITLLQYSNDKEHCERRPDGQFICYLPAPILKEMNLVDTPGINVVLQRQQRLTEDFVPRADLLLFVISADRPLTESEVVFVRYVQQWRKKIVFVLNKSDIYRNTSELEEAIAFIKENTQKLLNSEHVLLYPLSARLAIEGKLSSKAEDVEDNHSGYDGFNQLEEFLFSFLDRSTDRGMERMKLKVGTPIEIADRIVAACQKLVKKDIESANQDLISVKNIASDVEKYAMNMESERIMSWRRQTLSLIDAAEARVVRLVESTLRLSNLDLVVSYVFKGEATVGLMPATSIVQNDILCSAHSDVQKLLKEYFEWLNLNNAREGRLYKETIEKRWPSLATGLVHSRTDEEALMKKEQFSIKEIEIFSATAAAKLFEQEIRQVFFETFGGLGAAGLSASLLTSLLPTTLEDLLALGLCSTGGFIAISKFPTRRKEMIEKVKRTAGALSRELEDAMQKDLSEAMENLESYVKLISKPYQDATHERLDRLLELQKELTSVEEKLQGLKNQIQNLHLS
ncbi:hypothetical protein GIB67_006188 [Kingdonia uniflora]|uniref:G domain-containing protein n=1 Tax=Kingdonia uniflora TaxID=39325 RepID=A0A7J7LPU8_9MAGN|nr:hypothetical protein GIB67_006188 [Kingdonia uniflora]